MTTIACEDEGAVIARRVYERFAHEGLAPDDFADLTVAYMKPAIERAWNRQSVLATLALLGSAAAPAAAIPPQPTYRERLLALERARYAVRRRRLDRVKRELARRGALQEGD